MLPNQKPSLRRNQIHEWPDQLRTDGKKSVPLLVSNGEGKLRFVALGVQ
jgi:hypothetical protein